MVIIIYFSWPNSVPKPSGKLHKIHLQRPREQKRGDNSEIRQVETKDAVDSIEVGPPGRIVTDESVRRSHYGVLFLGVFQLVLEDFLAPH